MRLKTLELYKVEKEPTICAQVGYCTAVCPLFAEYRWEMDGPRGWIFTAKWLQHHGRRLPPRFARAVFERCTLCAACAQICATDIDTVRLIKAFRGEVGARGMWPTPIKKIATSLKATKNIFSLPNQDRNLWAMDIEERINPHLDKPAEFAYFVGCVTSFTARLASIAEAMVAILDSAKINYTLLGGREWCCANPLYLAGAPMQSHPFLEHNTTLIDGLGVKTAFSACSGCTRAFRAEYVEPRLGGWQGYFEFLHSSQLVLRLLDDKRLKLTQPVERRVVYHDPCEIGRHLGIYEPPRQVLQSIPGLKLLEFPKNREECVCCGGGGLCKAVNPEAGVRIAGKKIREAERLGAEVLASGCPACKLTFLDAKMALNSDIQILDIVELVAKSLPST